MGFKDPLSSFPYTATFCNSLPCGLIIWRLSIYGSATLRRAKYIAACYFRLEWTRFTFAAVNSFNGSSSAVVVSNCYNWISAISRSRKWSFAIYLSANLFVALKFVALLYFSGQDFIFETLMRGYSRRLDFLELNPIVDLRRDNEVDYSSHIITKEKQTVRVPLNEIGPIIGQVLLWEGPLWFPWLWRSTQTFSSCYRLQTWHWHYWAKFSASDLFCKVKHW